MRRENPREAVLYCRDGYVLKSLAEPFGSSFEVYCYKDVWYLTRSEPVRDCTKRTACEFTYNLIEYKMLKIINHVNLVTSVNTLK